MTSLDYLTTRIFADGANKTDIITLDQHPFIEGFTTNPTLMRLAGIENYEHFAKDILSRITNKPISFEVFSDDFNEMYHQALHIASWGKNVYVKIPVTNTEGKSSIPLIKALAKAQIKQNITAVMTLPQVQGIVAAIADGPPSYLSIFAGRIADTGVDPLSVMTAALELLNPYPHLELIWASCRELLNIFQANSIGCHIITVTPDICKKINLIGKDLDVYSLETVKSFYEDALKAGFTLDTYSKELYIP